MATDKPMTDKEERILSALAHGSAVAQGIGLLVGILLYVTQRNRSERVAFQALQAAVYQFVGLLLTMGLWVAWSIFHGLSYIPLIQAPEAFEQAPPPVFFISLAAMAVAVPGHDHLGSVRFTGGAANPVRAGLPLHYHRQAA